MPTYEYECADCGPFDMLRPVAQRDDELNCPRCNRPSRRVIVSAPRLAALNGRALLAHITNERAMHAPMTPGEYRAYRHPQGCRCCSGSGAKSMGTVRGPQGAKAFPSKRPWMISH